jgi:hypothetical protein
MPCDPSLVSERKSGWGDLAPRHDALGAQGFPSLSANKNGFGRQPLPSDEKNIVPPEEASVAQ